MLRSTTLIRYTTRIALFLPLALPLGCSGDDAVVKGDAGPSDGPHYDTSVDSAVDGAVAEAPKVISTSPLDAAIDESTNAIISATFNHAMDPTSIIGANFIVQQGSVAVAGKVTYANNTAFFAPASPLALNTKYTATLNTSVKDTGGKALAANFSWSFTTASVAAVGPAPVALGTAGNYVILAKSAVANVPTSVVTGDVGLSPAAASYITGFALTKAGTKFTSPQVIGSLFAADNDPPTPLALTTAVSDMLTAYTDAAGRPTPGFLDLGGGLIGGLTLAPGLYKWGTSVTIPSDIAIAGNANDTWIFQISGDLKMAAAKQMTLSGGARARNIVWQVAGIVDLGTTTHSEGIMLCKTAIKLGTGGSINGRLLAQTEVNIASSTVKGPQ